MLLHFITGPKVSSSFSEVKCVDYPGKLRRIYQKQLFCHASTEIMPSFLSGRILTSFFMLLKAPGVKECEKQERAVIMYR